MLLKLGSRGADVRLLQLQLRALGYDVGDIDGFFGPKTEGEVLAFQRDTDSIDDDGIVGTETTEALKQALVMKETEPFHEAAPPQAGVSVGGQTGIVPCAQETWDELEKLVGLLTNTPVKYGPGRGMFVNGEWVVNKGFGKLNQTAWASESGGTYASFHCTSFTNFFLGWLLRYDDDFTHAGNMPSLFDLCEQPNIAVTKAGLGTYRGYGQFCQQILTNGDTRKRNPAAQGLDIRELHDRRDKLPTFLVCGQSSLRGDGKWRLWHHTVLFVTDHAQPGKPMFRIAADGTKNKQTKKWSGKAMQWTEIDAAWIDRFTPRTYYRPYGVISLPDGSYDHLGSGPRPRVRIEGVDL